MLLSSAITDFLLSYSDLALLALEQHVYVCLVVFLAFHSDETEIFRPPSQCKYILGCGLSMFK